MFRTARHLRRGDRKGVAAVEFAIIAPVFFLLVIGFIELGRALMVQQVLTNASRVGARRAVALNVTHAQVIEAARDYAAGVAVPGISVQVTPSPAAARTGDPINVTVSIPYHDISWVPSPWFMGDATLEATSIMRKEGFE